MSNPNPINARLLEELADRLEQRRVPRLVDKWREQPPAAWQMRRQVRDAMRDEWRRMIQREDLSRAQLKVVVAAFNQLQHSLDAALLAADPNAFPALAGRAIRSHVRRK